MSAQVLDASKGLLVALKSRASGEYVGVAKGGSLAATHGFPLPLIDEVASSRASCFVLTACISEKENVAPEEDEGLIRHGSVVIIGQKPQKALAFDPSTQALIMVDLSASERRHRDLCFGAIVESANGPGEEADSLIGPGEAVTLRFDSHYLAVDKEKGFALSVDPSPAVVDQKLAKPVLFEIFPAIGPPVTALSAVRLLFPRLPEMAPPPQLQAVLRDADKCELLLLEELISSFLGCDGEVVRVEQDGRAFRAAFQLQAGLLRQELLRFGPLLEHIRLVSKLGVFLLSWDFGAVVNSFAAALNDFLSAFQLEVLGLEDLLRSTPSKLTLHGLWCQLAESRGAFEFLASLLQTLHGNKGAEFLSILHDAVQPITKSDDLFPLARSLMLGAHAPLQWVVCNWVIEGVLCPPSVLDFFIKDSHQGGQFSRFEIDSSSVPIYFESFTQKILRCGENQRIIQEFRPSKNLISNLNLPSIIENKSEFLKELENLYKISCEIVVDIFMNQLKVRERVESFVNFFLLRKADAFNYFLDMAAVDLDRPVSHALRLQSHFDTAVRSSSAHSDLFLKEFSCGISNMQLQELCRVFDSAWQTDAMQLTDEELSRAMGWEALPEDSRFSITAVQGEQAIRLFTLRCEMDPTVGQVLPQQVVVKYQMLNRLLTQFKFVEKKLAEVWQDQMLTNQLNRLNSAAASHLKICQFTGKRMLDFCRNFIYFITVEVIEPQRILFVNKLTILSSIQEFMKEHDMFISSCLRECLLTEAELFRSLAKVLALCNLFAKHALKFSMYGGTSTAFEDRRHDVTERERATDHFERLIDDEKYRNMVDRFSNHFDRNLLHFLKSLRTRSRTKYEHHIINLLTRLDFNLFYSRFYNTPLSTFAE